MIGTLRLMDVVVNHRTDFGVLMSMFSPDDSGIRPSILDFS